VPYDITNNCSLFDRLFKKNNNDIFLFGISFFIGLNISRDIVHSVFCNFSCTPYDIITFLICIIEKTSISLKRKKIFQKGKCHFFWQACQISCNYFSCHRHFKNKLKNCTINSMKCYVSSENSKKELRRLCFALI